MEDASATPADPHAPLVRAALALHESGRLPEACALYEQVLRAQPAHFDALHYLGVCLHQGGAPARALAALDAALLVRGDDGAAHLSRGNALRELGRLSEALEAYAQATRCAPQLDLAHYNLGTALEEAGRHAQALDAYRAALALRPTAAALAGAANCLLALQRPREALAAYRIVHQAVPHDADAMGNLASALIGVGEVQEALALAQAAAARGDEADGPTLYRCGQIFHNLGRLDRARDCYERARTRPGALPWLEFQIGVLDLLEGRFESGWRAHERRWDVPDNRPNRRDFAQPLWLGECDPRGMTLLVHAEQGFGDTVQFCRYLPLMTGRGARVIAEVQAPLLPLLRRSFPDGIEWVARGGPLPGFERHCPMLSLPLALQATATAIPARTPYLHADPARVARWHERLGGAPRRRVGLVWSGNPRHNNDRERSIALARLAPLFAVQGIEWVALQPQLREADRVLAGAFASLRVPGEAIADFDDVAALAALCERVICVDTAAAHVAGALDRPTWVLLPFVPDWRWMMGRDDSPWYPRARLYRQAAPGDWEGVVGRLVADLRTRADGA